MPTINVLNMEGKVCGEVTLSDKIFAAEINNAAVHSVVRAYLLNQRQGTQSTLTRSEVRGGGRKPWRQKGTGRARQGSIRSPQWTHGGIALGPKPRSYRVSINKKLKKIALFSALTSKVVSNELIVIDNIALDSYKTKNMVNFLKAINVDGKAVVITPEVNETVVKSARNIPGVLTTTAKILSVYDILNAKYLVIDQAALAIIEEVFA
ncbi:MAG: 50S ribosomal protein L4 [Clostridia bacterium]|nr:50S ribosomal protein L4 [Clostridia bacterium]